MKHLILLAISLALVSPLHAGRKNANAQNNPNPQAGKAFNRTDKDHDGFLSQDEFLARAKKVFNRKDKDSDGKLSPAELKGHKKDKSAKQDKGQKKDKAAKQAKDRKKDKAAQSDKDVE
jgi:hypothetical protein